MIVYTDLLTGITPDRLQGFFVDWPNPPSPETHLRVLTGSDQVHLAVDHDTNRVVGYVTAITDGVLAAYIPHLEVLPEYQGRGIGTELMRRMLATLSTLYMTDLLCDPDVQPFYARVGMRTATGMLVRNYDRQAGSPPASTPPARSLLPAGRRHRPPFCVYTGNDGSAGAPRRPRERLDTEWPASSASRSTPSS